MNEKKEPDPDQKPGMEKTNMTEPQEEFIGDEARPSITEEEVDS